MNSRQSLQTDLSVWDVGPYQSFLPGPVRLKLKLDGEIVVECDVETGYLHRGLEKACELHAWSSLVPYADHLDPEQAIFGELVVCMAVEEIAEMVVPARAQCIRMILAELTRISAHLLYIVKMAQAVGSETVVHYILRDREKILDLFELVTGARFSLNFLRFGGVREDITDGFIERVLEVCEVIKIRIREYNDLFTFNHSFVMRTTGVALMSPSLIRRCGITGPNARASGQSFDVRRNIAYLEYDRIDFKIPLVDPSQEFGGGVHDRFLVRLREINESMEILRQLAETVPSGPYANSAYGLGCHIPTGEAYARIESARGLLGCHIVSDGGPRPRRVQFRPPSTASLMAVPSIVQGIRVEDLPVVLASLDLGIAEVDR